MLIVRPDFQSPIPGLGNYPNYSASTQKYLNDNPVPSSAGIPTMTLGMIAPQYNATQTTQTYNNNPMSSFARIPTMTTSMIATSSLHNVSQTPKTLNLGGWAPPPYSPTNPNQLPPRNPVSPFFFSLGDKNNSTTPPQGNKSATSSPTNTSVATNATRQSSSAMKSTYKAQTSVSPVSPFAMKGTVGSVPPPSFVSQNNGGSFSFAASMLAMSSAPPVTNPYAGMSSGVSSWTVAGSDAKPSSGRPRSDWRTGKGANPSDVFAANLFPDLVIPQFGQTNSPGQNPFGPSVSQTISAANQAPSPSHANDDTTMEETTTCPTQVSSQQTIEGPSIEMGEASPIPTPTPTPTSFFVPPLAITEGAGFKFSAQARLNPGRPPVSKAEKSRSSRNRAGRQGLSFGSPTSKLASSFAPRLDHLSIDPQLTVQSVPPPPSNSMIDPQLLGQSQPPPPPPNAFIGPQLPAQPAQPVLPPPPSNPLIDPQFMGQSQPPPPPPSDAFIGPKLPVQLASPSSPSNGTAVPQSLEQQVDPKETTITNLKSEDQKEKDALQAQLSSMNAEVEKSKKPQLELQTQLSDSKANVEQGRKQHLMMQTQLSKSKTEVEQSRKRQTELQSQVSQMTAALEQSKLQNTQLQTQVSSLTAAAEKSRSQQAELQSHVSNMTVAAEQSQLKQSELQAQTFNLLADAEQYQTQAQEIAELKSALASNDRKPGKYDWVKDNTINHQRVEIESLTKQRNFHRKTANELQRARKAERRSEREFYALEKKIETREVENRSLQKKYEKHIEDTANRVAKIEARFEEKRVKLDESARFLRKEHREVKAEDNYVRAEAAEKKNAELLEGLTVLQQSYTEARAAVKEAEEKAKEVDGHAEKEREDLIKSHDLQLAEKNGLIADKDVFVAQKAEKIVELEDIIERKDRLLEALGADTVSLKNAQIVELQIAMKERNESSEPWRPSSLHAMLISWGSSPRRLNYAMSSVTSLPRSLTRCS